jgi:uncharacterized tellurite resistance protein B-like protein
MASSIPLKPSDTPQKDSQTLSDSPADQGDKGKAPVSPAVLSAPNHDLTARLHFQDIIEKISKPGGSASLNVEQRRFLMAALIGSVVPADGKIRPVELEKLREILIGKFSPKQKTLEQAEDLAHANLSTPQQLNIAASRLQDLLSIEDRCNLIGFLWDVALADYELHTNEEKLILRIADLAGVPRKKVIEQQARSAAKVG